MSSKQPVPTTSGLWTPHRPELVGVPYPEIGYLAREMCNNRQDLMMAAGMLAKAANEGHMIWWFGNGGSAAQADHFAAELVGRYRLERNAVGSMALCVSPAAMTAIANDYGYTQVFARQIAGCGRVGDVAVGLSTSGKSENVVYGLQAAAAAGLGTVLLTGVVDVGSNQYPAEVVVACPGCGSAAAIQEQHLAVGHLLCGVVEQLLFGKRG